MFSYTLIIVAITVLVSLGAFSNNELKNKLIMYPYGMNGHPSEYYRLLTSGFIHEDLPHLAFNMYALYMFGQYMEEQFAELSSAWVFVVLYLTGIIMASLPSLFKHRLHSYYAALGASGGVSAIIFAFIYFHPWARIGIMFIPVGIPAILFAVLYLLYSAYSARKGSGNIGHDAHFWGGVYGFVFAFFSDPTHGRIFIEQMQNFR